MFVACGIWCLADVSSVSPSSEQTGSGQNGPAHGSEPLSSPAPVGRKRGKLESCGSFYLNWSEPVTFGVFGRPDRTNEKRRTSVKWDILI